MRRFTVTQLLMGSALVAILFVFLQAEGSGRRFTMVECVSYSPDGSRIAVSKLNARDAQTPMKCYKADVSRTVSILAASNGTIAGIVKQDFRSGNCGPAFGLWRVGRTSAVFNPANGQLLAHDFGGGSIRQYDPKFHTETNVTQTDHPAFNIALSKSGKLVAACGNYELTIFNATSGKSVMHAQGEGVTLPFLKAAQVAFSDDEQRIVIASDEGVRMWGIASGSQSSTLVKGLDPWIRAIAMAPDDTVLVCSDHWVRRYDFAGNVVSTLSEGECCYACSVSSDGQHAAVLSDGKVVILDLVSSARTDFVLSGYATAMAFAPDGETLAVGDYDGKVSLIDVQTGNRYWSSSPPNGPLGRHPRPWMMLASFLAVWGFIAWQLSKKATTDGRRSADVQLQRCR